MSSHSTLEELEIVKFGRALPLPLLCLFCNLIYVFKCFFVLLRRLFVWLFWVVLNEIWFLFKKKNCLSLTKTREQRHFHLQKLIHPRYTTFVYGNLSAPTLRQVGRLLHSPTTLARSSHFPMLDIQALLTLKLGSIFWRTSAWRAKVLLTRDLIYGKVLRTRVSQLTQFPLNSNLKEW